MLLCLLYRYEYLYIYIYKSTRFIGLSKFKCFLCLSQDQEVYRIAGTTMILPTAAVSGNTTTTTGTI